MIDLSTKYLGLNLRNPIIVGSSGLTDSVEKIQKITDKTIEKIDAAIKAKEAEVMSV